MSNTETISAPAPAPVAEAPATAVAAPSPAPAPAGAPAPAPAPAGAPAPAPASVLGSFIQAAATPAAAPSPPAAAPTAAPTAPAGPLASIPEKFHVKHADGTPNIEASWAKVEEHRSHLERRLGSGDIPPTTVDGYKVNIPTDLADKVDAAELAATQGVKDLLGKLHAAGASQAIVDVAVGELLQRGVALRQAMPTLQAAECEATLRAQEGWKTDTEYNKQVGEAVRAGRSIFGDDFDAMLATFGSDQRFIKGLASIGPEMVEDTAASAGAMEQLGESLDAMQSSKAYMNPNDPNHAQTMAKVQALTARMYGTAPVAQGRSMSFKTG